MKQTKRYWWQTNTNTRLDLSCMVGCPECSQKRYDWQVYTGCTAQHAAHTASKSIGRSAIDVAAWYVHTRMHNLVVSEITAHPTCSKAGGDGWRNCRYRPSVKPTLSQTNERTWKKELALLVE